MKIHILFKFKEGPWGGGNQFLKALRKEFEKRGVYEEDSKKANAVIFNCNRRTILEKIDQVYKLGKKNKIIINRIDGPIYLKNRGSRFLDEAIIDLSNLLANGCIFQSNWALKEMKNVKSDIKCAFRVIHNAPNPDIFYPPQNNKAVNNKVSIIATSWSSNWKKGFDIYKYLDENLDFDKYRFVFIGNSPVKFKEIKHISPLTSEDLAEKLRQADIFMTASVNDPCSNSLIEALACGLPAVIRNSGGHPELIGKGGVVFNNRDDVLEAIDKLANNIEYYRKRIPVYGINHIGQQYLEFIKSVVNKQRQNKLDPLITRCKYRFLMIHLFLFKSRLIIYSIINKLRK